MMDGGVRQRVGTVLYRMYLPLADILYPLPGAVRVKWLLLRLCVRREGDSFVYVYDGVEIRLPEFQKFAELVGQDIIAGYTMKRDIRSGDVVLDIGAFPGEFMVYAARKGERVIAVEPNPDQADFLRRVVECNGLENVEVVEKAVWDEEGVVSLREDALESSVLEQGELEVEAVTLEAFREEHPSFVKMDVEGAEIEVLEQVDCLAPKPFVAVASYHVREGEKTFKEVEKRLNDAGYDVETGFPSHLTTYGNPG